MFNLRMELAFRQLPAQLKPINLPVKQVLNSVYAARPTPLLWRGNLATNDALAGRPAPKGWTP
jgi:hypothetical protein